MTKHELDNAVTLQGDATTVPAPGTRRQGLDTEIEPAEGMLFCPRRGVNYGATQRLDKSTGQLLHSRLNVLALLMIATSAASFVRFLIVEPRGLIGSGLLILGSLAVWVFLRQEKLSTGVLNATAIAIFAMGLVSMGINTFLLLGDALSAGDYAYYHAQANRLPGLHLLLMLAFAIFIPARWQQALWASALIVLGGMVPMVLLFWTYRAELRAAGDSIDRVEQVTFSLLVLFIGALFAVIGSHMIHGYRKRAAEVGDAGMYQLLGKLGEGGMGEVWRAEHRMLARPAAIKIIRPELLGGAGVADTATKRFTREARATAALQSPNTVQLYDFGSTDDGTFFYVMEMLRGMDMEDLVKQYGPLPPARAVHLLRQAADSLQEAHDRGLIHRDIKPGNLHVGVFAGHADWVKVLDFGLVKSSDDDQADKTALTVEGVTTGTPAYFPPEMAGGAGAASSQSDIYALSAVAYWLLTGELVFTGNTPLELVLQHVQQEPVPPSKRTENEIPADLEATIMSGLSKDPSGRPATMRDFAERLSGAGAGDWSAGRAHEWWNLHEPETFSGAA